MVVLKAEVDKWNFKKLVNITSGLNNWKTKVGDLDNDMLKTVLVDIKKLSE